MTDESAPITTLEWLQQNSDPSDPGDLRRYLRPEYKADMAFRFHSTAPHAGHAQRIAMLRDAKKAEPHKFFPGPTSPDTERDRLKNMTAIRRLEEANKNGGNK